MSKKTPKTASSSSSSASSSSPPPTKRPRAQADRAQEEALTAGEAAGADDFGSRSGGGGSGSGSGSGGSGSGSGSGGSGSGGGGGGSGSGGGGGGGGVGYLSSEEDEAPAVMVTIFQSAALKDISLSNARQGIPMVPSSSNVFLRPGMNFSIVLRAASMVSKLFEMVASVMSRGGGRESKGEIGFTIVMLHGTPHLAVDVWDDSQTIAVSVRISTDVYLHPDYMGQTGQFPVFRVTCKSMVEKLSHAKDFHRVMIYQSRKATNQLEILIDTPDKAGNVQHETVLIKSDQWESLRLEDVTHNYTLQLAIKNITQLCKMQHDATGKLTLTIYDIGSSVSPETSRQRQNFILKLEVANALDETSSTLRPVTTEIEKSVDPVTGEEHTTMHFVESQHRPALDLMEAIDGDGSKVTFRQSFVSGYIESFLSKFDPNKVVTLRLAKDNPMVISYSHGSLVICQMVAAPFVD